MATEARMATEEPVAMEERMVTEKRMVTEERMAAKMAAASRLGIGALPAERPLCVSDGLSDCRHLASRLPAAPTGAARAERGSEGVCRSSRTETSNL